MPVSTTWSLTQYFVNSSLTPSTRLHTYTDIHTCLCKFPFCCSSWQNKRHQKATQTHYVLLPPGLPKVCFIVNIYTSLNFMTVSIPGSHCQVLCGVADTARCPVHIRQIVMWNFVWLKICLHNFIRAASCVAIILLCHSIYRILCTHLHFMDPCGFTSTCFRCLLAIFIFEW